MKLGELILGSMLKANPELYEKCLDTPGFAYWFGQLSQLACEMPVTSLESSLAASNKALDVAIGTLNKIDAESVGPSAIYAEQALAEIKKLRGGE